MKLLFAIWFSLAVSCTHTAPESNSIITVHSNDEVDVWLQDSSVQPGDKVKFFRENCTFYERSRRTCKKAILGFGTVKKIIEGSKYNVRVDAGTSIDKHAKVEALTE